MSKNKKSTKVGVIKDYQTKGQRSINTAIKNGYGDAILAKYGTTDAKEIVKSKKGLDNLRRNLKVIKERPKIEQEVKDIDERRAQKLFERDEREYIITKINDTIASQSKELKNMYGVKSLKNLRYDRDYRHLPHFINYNNVKRMTRKWTNEDLWDMYNRIDSSTLKMNYQNMMRSEIDEFFNSYFKEVKFHNSCQKKIAEMKAHFSTAKGLCDYYDFVDYICADSFKGEYYGEKMEVDEYEKEMVDRCNRAYDLMKTGHYK